MSAENGEAISGFFTIPSRTQAMKSSPGDVTDAAGPTPRRRLDYPVLLAAVAGNLVLLLPLLLDEPPAGPYFALLVVLLVVPPAVMGYANQPFGLGVAVGVLPAFVMAVVDNPLSAAYIENMVKLGVVWGGLALPVATVLFVFGAAFESGRFVEATRKRWRGVRWLRSLSPR